jgi:hypothetical protein
MRAKFRLKPWEILLFSLLVLAALKTAGLLFGVHESEEAWDRFKAEHHCEAVGQIQGSNRAGWRCDDGRTYYRWRQQR